MRLEEMLFKSGQSTVPGGTNFPALYQAKCERSPAVSRDKSKSTPPPPIPFVQCAVQLAGADTPEAQTLKHMLEVASKRVEVPVPLRWL